MGRSEEGGLAALNSLTLRKTAEQNHAPHLGVLKNERQA
jgi:hypothetical protein